MKRTIFGFFPTSVSSFVCLHTSQLPQPKFVIFQFRFFFSSSLVRYQLRECVFFFFVSSNLVPSLFRLPLSNIHSNIYNLESQAYKRLLFICPFPMIWPYLLLLVLFFHCYFWYLFSAFAFSVYLFPFVHSTFAIRHKIFILYIYIYTYIFEILQCARTNRNKLFT